MIVVRHVKIFEEVKNLDEGEMSQILKEAFRLYGSEIAQACNVPTALKPLVNGLDAQVTVHLSKGNTLTFTEIIEDETYAKKLRVCRQTVKKQTETNKNIQVETPKNQVVDVSGNTVTYTVDASGTQTKEE